MAITINQNGGVFEVLRDAEKIGIFDTESKAVKLTVQQPPVVKGQISAALGELSLTVESFGLVESLEPEPENHPHAEPLPTPEPAPAASIPPIPQKDPALGDKTPEVVEWYRKYKPEEYAKRYHNRELNGKLRQREDLAKEAANA